MRPRRENGHGQVTEVGTNEQSNPDKHFARCEAWLAEIKSECAEQSA